MNCEHASEQIGAWIDRQLLPEQAAALEEHLAGCAECRSAAEALRSQDAELSRAFAPARVAAGRVAAAVISRLHDERADRASPLTFVDRRRPRTNFVLHIVAAAAGFLLAIILFPPWNRPIEAPPVVNVAPNNAVPPNNTPAAEQAVAQLVVATGDVEVRPFAAAAWATHPVASPFLCPSDGVVRTGPNVQCEWKTVDGSVVRLNGDTQVRFASAGVVEVQRGQIACMSPENASLKVIVPERNASAPGASPTGTSSTAFTCQWQSSALAAVEPGGDVQVTSSAGEIAVETPAGTTPLKQGESVRLVEGRIVPTRAPDPILAAGWTGALLVKKGHDDPELGRRVDELLARIGQSKVAYLYEDEIRSLGEHAVLPLLKYVESPISKDDRVRRQVAVRLAADLAPTWAVSDLIRLLADPDAEVRYQAALALRRLTGTDQGRPPDAWREDLKNCEPTIELWRKWRLEEPNRFPPRKPDRQT